MPSWKVTNRASITNQPAWIVGGLGPTIGKGQFASNAIKINANGQGQFRFRTFCTNQLGNIGGGLKNSMFGSSSDGTTGCRDQQCVNPPYCINLDRPYICDKNKALSGSFKYEVTVGKAEGVVCATFKGYIARGPYNILGDIIVDDNGMINRSYLFEPDIKVIALAYRFPKTCSPGEKYGILLEGCIDNERICKSNWTFTFNKSGTSFVVKYPGGGLEVEGHSFIINMNSILRSIVNVQQGETYSLTITATPK